MSAFSSLLDILSEVPDPRRARGKLYKLPHVLLFSILAIISDSNSYRDIVTFIDVHRRRPNRSFGLKLRRAPSQIAIRYPSWTVGGDRLRNEWMEANDI